MREFGRLRTPDLGLMRFLYPALSRNGAAPPCRSGVSRATRWVCRAAGWLLHPQLAQQRAPLRVVLVVPYALGDEAHERSVERGDDRSASEDRVLEPLPEPDGLGRIVHLRRRRAVHLRVDRPVAEAGEVRRRLG